MSSVLHICSYFNTSSLYKNLFVSLLDNGVFGEVFIPMYKGQRLVEDYGTVRDFSTSISGLRYNYSYHLRKPDRFFLEHRIKKSFKRLEIEHRINNFSVIHAHSLLYNGGIALRAHRKYGIPYIVAVRSTDLDILTRFPFYKKLACDIINNARQIVFISKSLEQKFISIIGVGRLDINKASVIPNGINENWYEDFSETKKPFNKNKVMFVYQGTLHKRKNVGYIIKIIEELNRKGLNCFLKIVGNGPEYTNIINAVNSSSEKDKITVELWSTDFSRILKNYLDADVFIMPSRGETFGISYIEALAAGLPVVYTIGDGIDGMLSELQGVGLDLSSIDDDVEKIMGLVSNYNAYLEHLDDKTFRWKDISKEYLRLYSN